MTKVVLAALALYALWLLFRSRTRPVATPALDEREARAVLGVSADAGPDAIRAAHRRLAAGVHPDRGGSTELARRVNAARDVLLKN